jgi:TDG/mug DNA glycosylase family protein
VRLRDIIVENPRILLVGINPGLRSGAVGHHFAGNGNPFWRLLHASGIIPIPLKWEEGARLAEFGIALTNVCSRSTASAAELKKDEIERGMRILKRKIRRLKPQVVAFVGLDIYRNFFGHKSSGGPGPKTDVFAEARIFALPNPSGINANFPGFAHKLVWFEQLRKFVDQLEK